MEQSTFRVHLGKAGWLRMFGDEHEIAVSEFAADIRFQPESPATGSVAFTIPARALRVLDPHLTPEQRAEVQTKMEGPEVLDIRQFPEIRFTSTQVTPRGDARYRMHGTLKIRSSAREISLEMTLTPQAEGYRARGEVPVRMSYFGIEPPSAGAGSVKVKDEMKVTFDLLLKPEPAW